MALIWISSTILVALSFYFLQFLIINMKRKNRLPPGPRGLPIIGHFHLLGKNPHRDLSRLAKKHGPIMYMRFGSLPTVVASSPSTAEFFLNTHDLIFASRGHHEAGYHLTYQQRDIVFGQYSPYWRHMRKLVTKELLSNRKITEFQEMRSEEITAFVDSIKRSAKMQETLDLSVGVMGLNVDMICLMVFGRKFLDNDLDGRWFKEVLSEIMHESGAFNIGDYFPYLRPLDIQGCARRMKNLSKRFDGILERIIDEHTQNNHGGKQTRDFVDTMMAILESGEAEFEFDRRHVKAVLLDMLLAGIETSSTVVEWTLSELFRHPTIMKKLQDEVSEVVGMDQMVEESHLPKLDYLNCVIKETLRIHPVAPLLMHHSMEDSVVDGFDIPKSTRIFVNMWAIGRDPQAWCDPETFYPERFIGSNIDIRGNDFELIPFGSGRRMCPGLQLGMNVVQLIVAQLVHCFDWKLPNNEDLDMTENFGMVMGRAKHLLAIPTYRLYK